MNWMFAAILICGASVVVTSCGDDDDDKGTQQPTTGNTYEVTLSVVVPQCAADLFTVNVDYTGSDGKSNTVTVKDGDKSEALPADVQKYYDNQKESIIKGYKISSDSTAFLDNIIVKNIVLTIPTGKSFSYSGTLKARTDYKTPSGETFHYLAPFIYPSYKIISGNAPSSTVLSENFTLRVSLSVETEHVAEFIDIWNNTNIGKGSLTMD